jgi:arylformamidase
MKGPSRGAGIGWIDISVPLKTGMVVYPGDAPVLIDRPCDVARGDRVTLSRVSMGLHAGTHVDAPLHLFEKGLPVDRVPLAALIGTAQVIDIMDEASITRPEVEAHLTEGCGIVLFKTRNSALWRQVGFYASYVSLSAGAAEYLVKKGVSAVGIDYLSIDAFGQDELKAHATLLCASIPVIEGLDLSHVGAGLYECICLPLRVEGGEAAPARVIVRPLQS